ncbi:MAG: CpaE family protein [Isosphaerales bacterium]
MYPLRVVLVGIDQGFLPVLRRELTHGTAEVESAFAFASAAIECHRHSRKLPKLLIVQIGPDCQADAIQRLATGLAGWPILALLSSDNAGDFLQVNRAGAVQVVPLPLDHDDFHRALSVIGSQFDKGPSDRHVFAVTGAVGGSGATTIAVNLAYEIAEQLRRSTILAELSQQMGVLASMFDVQPRMTLPDLIREIHRVDDVLLEKALVRVSDGLRILAGPDVLQSLHAVDSEHLIKLVGCMRKLAEVTILDMPGAFDDLEFQVLGVCDRVIVVGNQNVPSIRSLKLFCDSLPEERLVHSVWVVLNRYHRGVKGLTCDDVKQMLGVSHVLSIANDFKAVNLSVNKGRPLRQVAPGTPILHDLRVLIHEIMSLELDHSKTNGRGFLGRVLHALNR